MLVLRSMLRFVAPRTGRASFSTYNDKLLELRMVHSREPAPYTSGIPIVPKDIDGTGHEHKKVTVVGCGQVGMAIAVSPLHIISIF